MAGKIGKDVEDQYVPVTESGCWLWEGVCNDDGYGNKKIKQKTYKAHRLMYERYKGSIPKGMCVLHKCDIPSCVNPEHLYIGTHNDNMKDMWGKSRHPIPSHLPGAKLSREDVKEIRKQEGSKVARLLAEEYGMNINSVYKIWKRKTWKDLM